MNRTVPKETTVYVKPHSGLLQHLSQFYSKLLGVQYGCRVVYFGEWDANGDYIDMYQDTTLFVQNVGWSRELLWHTSQGTVNYWWCNMDVDCLWRLL